MKNLKLSFLAATIAIGVFVISSCGPGEDPVLPPVLNFLAGAGYTSDDATVVVNSNFKVGLAASHHSKIETLKIRVSYDGGANVIPDNCGMCDTTIGEKEFTVDFENKVEKKAGEETWSFIVADKDGNSTTRTIKFTRTSAPRAIRKISLTLGNQDATTVGSSMDMELLQILLLGAAKTASETIDLIYVNDDIDGSILCSPSSATAADKLPGASGVDTWATRNATKLRKTTYTSTQYENMSDSKELLDQVNSSAATVDKVISLAGGDVVYVEPVSTGGRFALVKINSIDVDNTMTVQVLVEL